MIALLLISSLMAGEPADSKEQGLIGALELVRIREFDQALGTLEELCPLPLREVSKAADRGDTACQIRVFVTVEREDPSDAKSFADIYWLEGDKSHKAGRLALAEALFQVSTQRCAHDPVAWHSVGMLYRDMDKLDAALSSLQRAHELDETDPYTLYWVATTLMDLGKLEEAEHTLDEVLRLDPEHARVWYRRGEIHMIRGDYEQAIADFTAAKKRGVRRQQVKAKIRECEKLAGTH